MLKRKIKNLWIRVERNMPDSIALRMMYYRCLGRVLHLNHPKSYTEKIQWLKINYRLPIVQQLACKYESRALVAERVGPQVLNEMYGVWDRPEDIPFDSLPDAFALKVTNASHANIFCRDKSKLNIEETKANLTKWMARNYFDFSREWSYKHLKPRIIAERLLDDEQGNSPPDYKFYCFNGKPGFIEVDFGRHRGLTITFLDLDWQVLPFTYHTYPSHPTPLPRPSNLAEMTAFAEILAKDFPFSRVDFYSVQGRTIFGEITWYPGAGMAPFNPFEYDMQIGSRIQLPAKAISRS